MKDSSKRRCDSCGERYFRRNLVEVWDSINPGHRAGWHKSKRRICTKCMSVSVANRALAAVSFRIVGTRRRKIG